MKQLFLLVALVSSLGCVHTTVTPLTAREAFNSSCPVTIFSDMETARAKGEIVEEACVVTAQGDYVKDVIKDAKSHVCCCGTNFAVIKSIENPSLFKAANVVLVGIRYKDQKDDPGAPSEALSPYSRADMWKERARRNFCN